MVRPWLIISIRTSSRIKPLEFKVSPTMVLGWSGVKGIGRLAVGALSKSGWSDGLGGVGATPNFCLGKTWSGKGFGSFIIAAGLMVF